MVYCETRREAAFGYAWFWWLRERFEIEHTHQRGKHLRAGLLEDETPPR